MKTQNTEEKTIVSFDNVAFDYGPVEVLKDASFHIHRGEFIALVGPNGAGKTTVLKLLLGLERPSKGTIEVFGLPPRKGRSRIGYVPQHANYDSSFPISVREVVHMGRLLPRIRDKGPDRLRAVEEAMRRADILDLADRPYSALSGGQRRRVLVARALAAEPDLLILDEPTANMDRESEERLFRTLGDLKGNTTVVIVTHDSSFVSGLTDVVLCVGERTKEGCTRTVMRHSTEPLRDAPANLFGGSAAKVLHDSDLPDVCCENCGKRGCK